jgi:hypothetical protein
MEQRLSYAAAMDAQTLSSKEECASNMGQRSNDAVKKDAQIKLKEVDFAFGMGHLEIHTMNRFSAFVLLSSSKMKDAQNKLSMEECVSNMGRE